MATTVPHRSIKHDSGKGVWKRRLEPALKMPGRYVHVANAADGDKAYMLAHNLADGSITANAYRQPGVWDVLTVEGKRQVYAKLVMPLADAYSYRHHHIN